MKTRNLIILGLAVILSACVSSRPVKPECAIKWPLGFSPCAYYSDGQNATFRCIDCPTADDLKNRCEWFNGHCCTAEDFKKAEKFLDKKQQEHEEYVRTHPDYHPTETEEMRKQREERDARYREEEKENMARFHKEMDKIDARFDKEMDRQFLEELLLNLYYIP